MIGIIQTWSCNCFRNLHANPSGQKNSSTSRYLPNNRIKNILDCTVKLKVKKFGLTYFNNSLDEKFTLLFN